MYRARPAGKPLTGSRVLITGGSSGIGLACAHRLSGAGARLALLSRGEEALGEAAASLEPRPLTVAADVKDAAQLEAALGQVAGSMGGLDAVVANAGAAAYGPFADMGPDDFHRTVEITLLGVLNTAHAALPHLERSRGTLVIVGSVAGRIPSPWLSAYAAAKHGVRGFARSLSAELAALRVPVEVALIAPGPVDTPFWRRSRTTDGRLPPEVHGSYQPEEVAAEVARALRHPRPERTVGGAMAAWVLADSIAPGLTLRLTGPLARLGWRKRMQREADPADALSRPQESAEPYGGLVNRPSALRRLRDLVER